LIGKDRNRIKSECGRRVSLTRGSVRHFENCHLGVEVYRRLCASESRRQSDLETPPVDLGKVFEEHFPFYNRWYRTVANRKTAFPGDDIGDPELLRVFAVLFVCGPAFHLMIAALKVKLGKEHRWRRNVWHTQKRMVLQPEHRGNGFSPGARILIQARYQHPSGVF
jgi:hypothetical protein